jgi:hypothetical protein
LTGRAAAGGDELFAAAGVSVLSAAGGFELEQAIGSNKTIRRSGNSSFVIRSILFSAAGFIADDPLTFDISDLSVLHDADGPLEEPDQFDFWRWDSQGASKL